MWNEEEGEGIIGCGIGLESEAIVEGDRNGLACS